MIISPEGVNIVKEAIGFIDAGFLASAKASLRDLIRMQENEYEEEARDHEEYVIKCTVVRLQESGIDMSAFDCIRERFPEVFSPHVKEELPF